MEFKLLSNPWMLRANINSIIKLHEKGKGNIGKVINLVVIHFIELFDKH